MSINRPRPEYYAFSHQALPEIFFSDPQKLISTLNESGAEFLYYLWHQVEKYAGVAESQVEQQIQVEHQTIQGISLTLVTLPPPQNMTEAYYLALLVKPGEQKYSRYLTLEHSQIPPGKPCTVLGEWLAGGAHIHHGQGPEPEKDLFVESISQLLS